MRVKVIGGGLAGCEASYQLSKRGIRVDLYDMKPDKKSSAHNEDMLCELVCSNSFRGDSLSNAVGLLKQELREMDSLIMSAACKTRVPAGGALAVDRKRFSKEVTDFILKDKNINVICEEITEIDMNEPTIIATGPLTSDKLFAFLKDKINEDYLRFFDAVAPIVSGDSIDFENAFIADRYDKGDGDYVNCPLSREEYDVFYNNLINAETVKFHNFENINIFEGCMPVEVMAKRGYDTMRFGMLKPVGLKNPKDDKKPYAVVQLRKEDVGGSMYNIVGFQTHLTFGEQKRVFSLIPALKNAEFLRLGVMHRNTYINSPKLLTEFYSLKDNGNIFFAGQITGVEGYVESCASGLCCGINMARKLQGKSLISFSPKTALGSLARYVSSYGGDNFQPMNINFGIIEPLNMRIKDKKSEREAIAALSIGIIKEEYIDV